MKLLPLGIGVVFLLNPILGVNDVLPDFIGLLLIMYGIRDASYMIEKLASARRWFGYGAALSLVRFAVTFMGVERQHTLPLTLAFSFAVVELIILIPAVKNLFEGFDYAAMRHGGSGVLSLGVREGFYTDEAGVRQYGRIAEDTTGKLAGWLTAFIVIRDVMSLLPELPALQLTESENVGDVTGFQFSSISTLIRAVVVVVVLIPSVIVLVKYLRFLIKIKRAGDFVPALDEELSRRFGNLSELHTASRMKTTALAAGGALLLYMGLYDYQMNIIPRFVPAALLIVATVMLALSADKKLLYLLPVIPAVATVPLSVRTKALQVERYALYKKVMLEMMDSEATYVPDTNINSVDDEYIRLALWESGEAIVLGLGLVLFCLLYARLVRKHAAEFAIVPDRDRGPLGKSLKLRGVLMLGGAVLTAVVFTAYRWVLPYFDFAPMTGIAVNIVAVALYAMFATQAGSYVYGNSYEL